MVRFRAVEQQEFGTADPLQETELEARPNKARGNTVDQSQGRSPGPMVEEPVCVETSQTPPDPHFDQQLAGCPGRSGGVDPTLQGQDQHRVP